MGRGRSISVDLKQRILNSFRNGMRKAKIARNFGLHRSIVSRIIKRYVSTGNICIVKNSGRPKKSTQREDRTLIRISNENPFLSSTKISTILNGEHNIDLSARTVRRRLVENGLFGRRPAKKPLLSRKNRLARLEFAKNHQNWSTEMWKKVVFSDESKFNLFRSDGICHVRRPSGQRLNPKYTCPTVKHGGGSVMVWGCFSGYGMGPLHRITGNMDRFMYKDILETRLEPYTDDIMPLRFIFQQDNDPKHSSKLVKGWFLENKINVLKWPSQSPDLNPIENLWEYVDKKIRVKNYSNVDTLYEALEEAWKTIDQRIIVNLLESMQRRCTAVIQAKGYYTKY